MRSGSANVGGLDFALREAGEGEPVLYVHGFPTSGFLWRHVMVETSKGFRAIAPDLPGFGDSPLMDQPHTWAALVEWVDQLVDTMNIAPVHLAVHDWGGMIGIAWACRHPDKVRSLLITDTSFRSKDRWHALAEQWRGAGTGEELIGGMSEEGFRGMLSAMGQLPDDALTEYWKGLATLERRLAKLEMYRSLDFEMLAPLEERLPEVASHGVCLVWGGNDPFVPPKVGMRLAERLGGELTVLEGVGHFVPEHAGTELGRLHREFLESL
jgi:pimeloyl-ACP methyl ester carboxylesterase